MKNDLSFSTGRILFENFWYWNSLSFRKEVIKDCLKNSPQSILWFESVIRRKIENQPLLNNVEKYEKAIAELRRLYVLEDL